MSNENNNEAKVIDMTATESENVNEKIALFWKKVAQKFAQSTKVDHL